MSAIFIERLDTFVDEAVALVTAGYTTSEVYTVETAETADSVRFVLRLTRLEEPLVKRFPEPDAETREVYTRLARDGHGFGVLVDGRCLGVAITEPRDWHRSLWVHEFHIAPGQRGMGLGRRLMERVFDEARELRMRCVVCETQNTNVAAIAFYRALGFRVEGIDLSYYSNEDVARGEVAVFMKRPLADQ